MGTEVVELPAEGEDQEEGEIIDVEAYENNDFLDLESISSEEEENLRDRIRELETRNKELEKLAAVAKEERRTYNYDNSDFVTISSEEEFFEPEFPKFKVRMLYPTKKKPNGMGRGKNRRANFRYKSPERFRSDIVSHQDFKRRRRSLSPEYYQRAKNDRSRERMRHERVHNNDHYRSRERKKKKKRSMKRQHSESESENEKYVRSQLNAALKRDTRVSSLNEENPLMKKLKLRPGSANKENERSTTNGDAKVMSKDNRVTDEEDDEDDELIALRLQALKSKQEVKELIKDVSLVLNETEKPESNALPDVKSNDFDEDEYELRMIALKSAIVKKAVARKKQNERPYSPTDGLEWTPASPDNPYASSESNMQISPAISPRLDDAVLQPIDMEIATPENMSNSPTFYSFDESSTKLAPCNVAQQPMQDFSNPWASIIPVIMPIPVIYAGQVVPVLTKTTKNGVPLEMLSRPVRDEVTNCRSNTQSPCNQVAISDTNVNLRPRSRSLDSLQSNIQSTNNKETIVESSESSKPSQVMEDDEEQALRTLLLAKLASPNRPPKKTVPLTINPTTVTDQSLHDKELTNIEDNLKRAANRYKELSEHEEELIEASLDKILSRELTETKETPKTEPTVNLKDAVQRLKLSQAKDKLSKVSEELPIVETVEKTVIRDTQEPDSTFSPSTDEEIKQTDLVEKENVESQNVPEPAQTVVTLKAVSPLPEAHKVEQTPKPVIAPDVPNTVKPIKPAITRAKTVSQLKPQQITRAMASIASATTSKPKPSVLTSKPAPVIMKRKLKTNSSIINVPFQHKASTTTTINSSSPKNIPSTSSTSTPILSLENVIKPVPKVIIRLGQSSSEDSDTDSDDDSEDTEMNESNISNLNSAVASPSHITEFNDVNVQSPVTSTKTAVINQEKDGSGVKEKPKPLVKVDSAFESKLDEFLKQARAKTEKATSSSSPKKGKIVPKPVQKTPSAVRHLPISSQIEYQKLLAKMQLLEKQKQARLRCQLKSKINVEPGGNIKVTVDNTVKPTTTTTPEIVKEVSPNEDLAKNDPVRTKTTSESSDSFESRISKMTEEQKDKALQKYETTYNNFSHQFVTQLSEFMNTITEATVEKRKQIQLEMEAEELRAKLAAVESQLNHQRDKVGKIYPKISSTHKKILQSRDKYIKMGKCCTKLGQTVKGTDYQFKNEAKDKIFEKLRELPTKTKQLKNAKAEYLQEMKEKTKENVNAYKSVLDCMSTETAGTNHDGVLCPFDLSGKCSDKECVYRHLP